MSRGHFKTNPLWAKQNRFRHLSGDPVSKICGRAAISDPFTLRGHPGRVTLSSTSLDAWGLEPLDTRRCGLNCSADPGIAKAVPRHSEGPHRLRRRGVVVAIEPDDLKNAVMLTRHESIPVQYRSPAGLRESNRRRGQSRPLPTHSEYSAQRQRGEHHMPSKRSL